MKIIAPSLSELSISFEQDDSLNHESPLPPSGIQAKLILKQEFKSYFKSMDVKELARGICKTICPEIIITVEETNGNLHGCETCYLLTLSGPPAAVGHAKNLLTQLQNFLKKRRCIKDQEINRILKGTSNLNRYDSLLESMKMNFYTFPRSRVPEVTGPDGTYAVGLQHWTGCSLLFSESTFSESEDKCVLILFGTDQQIKLAVNLIQHRLF